VSTQPTGPSASAPPSAAEQTKPFRQLIALVLLAGTAVLLLLAFARLLLVFDDFGGGFTQRANATFADFVGLPQMIALAVAVLIATHVRPPVPMARVITLVALIEVAFAAFFGLICMFAGFAFTVSGGEFSDGDLRTALENLLARLVLLAFLGIVGFVALRSLRAFAPVPAPQQYGYPAGYTTGAQPAVPSAACVAISAPIPSNWPLSPCRLCWYSSDVM